MKIKTETPYIKGTLGCDFRLSLIQKIKILFSKTLSVIFVEGKFE